jgi:CDP-diacylglycerol--glycerol-3-phosphate 3-phosphatidyltransferase
MAKFVFLSDKTKDRYLRVIGPVGNLFARLGVHPNALSIAGLILSITAGLVYSTGSFFWGAWVVALAGTCDSLDGRLARQTEKSSPFGAFLDSTLDRFGEMFVFLGLAWHFAGGAALTGYPDTGSSPSQSPAAVIFIILAIAGSFMVSYTRARAEGLGADCKVGWMQRPERVVLLIIGSLLASIPVVGRLVMVLTLLLLAILANVTAVQRIYHVRKQLADRTRPTHEG